MKTELLDKISAIVAALAVPLEAYLVDVSMRGERGSSVVEVFVDTDSGITADQCAEMSRGLAQELDVHELIKGRYRLEVSSPGLDRPLKLPRQFRKNIGRHLEIVTTTEKGNTSMSGVLTEATEDAISLATQESGTVTVVRENIREARVLPQLKKRV